MFKLKRLIGGSLVVLFIAGAALAQENLAPIDTSRDSVPAAPLVTATASSQRVRFVSPGTVVQLRLEVYNEAGQKLFDTELHGGNVLDWHLQDGGGLRLPAGSYGCVLTIKSLSGRLSQRVGVVNVNDKEAAIETAGAAQLTTAQQQTIGPVEGSASLTILRQRETEAITTVTHDSAKGQLTSTTGPLTFGTGDVFAGKDKEHMRITEDGSVGIGTDKPEATLDVAGLIRAREGFQFSDGSTLKVNEKGVLTRARADGSAPDSVSSTQNKIAKFIDNAGTLGDSSLTDAGGNVGLGVTSPGDLLDIAGAPNNSGRSGIHVRTTTSTGNATLYFDNDRGGFAAYGGVLTGGSSNPLIFFGVTRADKTFLIADGASSLGLGIGTLVPKPVILGTDNLERMRIDSSGNVGISTTAPGFPLTVNGVINSTTGGFRFPDGTTQTTAAAGGSAPANYLFSYTNNSQFHDGTANLWKDINFSTDPQINGWTHPASGPSFICAQTGLYLIEYAAELGNASGSTISMRVVLNDVVIDGGSLSIVMPSVTFVPVSKSFIASISSGDVLKLQLTGSDSSGGIIEKVASVGEPRPSASITIIKIQ